ncbi:hypothetical protein GCM10018787_36940 [Streptomyces thermodiastaticus]|nr:hypothetical protein GCM10018787_36940 [Streptomyces thermodiastaticus]
MVAVHARQRAAAAARLPFVARLVHVLDIRAAGALQQVPGRGGRVAQLAGGAREQRLRQRRVTAAHQRMGRQVAVAHHGPHPQRTAGQLLDAVQRQPAHVDQGGGLLHPELHKVHQVGAARRMARPGARGEDLGRLLDGARADVRERFHRATSSTASTMRG